MSSDGGVDSCADQNERYKAQSNTHRAGLYFEEKSLLVCSASRVPRLRTKQQAPMEMESQ